MVVHLLQEHDLPERALQAAQDGDAKAGARVDRKAMVAGSPATARTSCAMVLQRAAEPSAMIEWL